MDLTQRPKQWKIVKTQPISAHYLDEYCLLNGRGTSPGTAPDALERRFLYSYLDPVLHGFPRVAVTEKFIPRLSVVHIRDLLESLCTTGNEESLNV